jgi:hypothetical protein
MGLGALRSSPRRRVVGADQVGVEAHSSARFFKRACSVFNLDVDAGRHDWFF